MHSVHSSVHNLFSDFYWTIGNQLWSVSFLSLWRCFILIHRLCCICKVSLGSFSSMLSLKAYTQYINRGSCLPDFLFVTVWQVLNSKCKSWTWGLCFLPDISQSCHSQPLPRWANQGLHVPVPSHCSLHLCWVILELVEHCHTCAVNGAWAYTCVVTESKTFSYLHCNPSTIM